MRLSPILLAIAAAAGATPGAVQSPPTDLNQFGLVCFCTSRVATPHRPIALDNNGRILFEARNGITRDGLASAGVPASDSQLQMLQDWGLLTKDKGLLKTNFPVLDPDGMATLRRRLAPVSKALLPLLAADVESIKAELGRRGQSDFAYTIIFSYVLDGLVWRKLEAAGRLPKMEISVEHPYWAGTFWAVYPKQQAMPGTNSREQGRYSLRMLWTPRVIDQVHKFQTAQETAAWLDALEAGRPLPSLYPDSRIEPLVIREDREDPMFLIGRRAADAVAAAMLKTDLTAELPQADSSQRLLIGTHELIWMLLADVAARQGLEPPNVLSAGATRPSDLSPLVIGIVSPPGKP